MSVTLPAAAAKAAAAQLEDVACAVWFLASAYASYVTGEVLHVDGGFKME